jgi:hypothetical protein
VEIPFVLCTGTSPLSEGKLRVMVVEWKIIFLIFLQKDLFTRLSQS